MIKEWRRRRAVQRVKPGDGRELRRFRWWQMTFRSLFYLRLTNDDGRQSVYAVDVRHGQDASSGGVTADLYLDGRQHAVCRLPAAFPVPGGIVEVGRSGFGLKRCHYVTDKGAEYPLVPDRYSGEGRRAHFDRAHPATSRCISSLSVVVLVVALALLVYQVFGAVSEVPPVVEHFGDVDLPVRPPSWFNIAVGACAAAASVERAMRLRFSRLLDGSAG
ncbi:hypothetical protein DSC45_10745 [Streptomyces sp. YIM 130001]|uniref:hypothetical protein n=1 Tax=Streptomyces sp. YIM 130001 TaxID=2259644 RepID=UPI000E655295|nr:hypothetical protein [Streptomyces sp. YIM 130001]RII18386.1 hypothetical protein DSC45_10745 [Streptomyces sp. YIM 130001]